MMWMIVFIFKKLDTKTFIIKFREWAKLLTYILKIGKSKSKYKLSTFKEKLEPLQGKIVQAYWINKIHLNFLQKIKNKMNKVHKEPVLLIFQTD